MTSAHSLLRPLTKAGLAAVILYAAATPRARANENCVGEGQVQLCPPILTNIESPPNAIVVHWLTQGGVPPDRVALVSEGTLARRFADGHILASENKAGPAGGFATYAFTLPAPAGASFPTLHLLGIWGDQTLTSAGFSAATGKVENYAPPVITSSSFQNDLMHVAWTAGRNWPRYNVRWERDKLDGGAQQHEARGGVSSDFATHALNQPGTYLFIVQGCDPHVFSGSNCSGWSAPVKVLAMGAAPPKVLTYNWPNLASGDCEMKDASVTFRANGTATFAAQVKTHPNHDRNVWHTTLTGETAAGETLFSMGTLDGPSMHASHGWYSWSKDFAFDPAPFARLGKVDLRHKC